jgi:hypothetical protein
MNNPQRILTTLDRHLTRPAEITLFGRAAVALGYPNPPDAFFTTHDVDGILPLNWLQADETGENVDFWSAIESTNRELEPEGLYLTHLFREFDVILRAQWLQHRVTIPLDYPKLQVYRTATIDLILTKMARGDRDDLSDIEFLLKQDSISLEQLEAAFADARVPEIPEIQSLFAQSKMSVISLA